MGRDGVDELVDRPTEGDYSLPVVCLKLMDPVGDAAKSGYYVWIG